MGKIKKNSVAMGQKYDVTFLNSNNKKKKTRKLLEGVDLCNFG